jgi:hypothetical protein
LQTNNLPRAKKQASVCRVITCLRAARKLKTLAEYLDGHAFEDLRLRPKQPSQNSGVTA